MMICNKSRNVIEIKFHLCWNRVLCSMGWPPFKVEMPVAFPGNSDGISGNAPEDEFPEMPCAFPRHFQNGNAWKCHLNFPEMSVEFPPMWKYSWCFSFFYGLCFTRWSKCPKWLVHWLVNRHQKKCKIRFKSSVKCSYIVVIEC